MRLRHGDSTQRKHVLVSRIDVISPEANLHGVASSRHVEAVVCAGGCHAGDAKTEITEAKLDVNGRALCGVRNDSTNPMPR
jgi:hypothetical protein